MSINCKKFPGKFWSHNCLPDRYKSLRERLTPWTRSCSSVIVGTRPRRARWTASRRWYRSETWPLASRRPCSSQTLPRGRRTFTGSRQKSLCYMKSSPRTETRYRSFIIADKMVMHLIIVVITRCMIRKYQLLEL